MSLKRKLGPEVRTAAKRLKVAAPALRLEGRREKRDAFYRELESKHRELEEMRREDQLSSLLREEELMKLDRKRRQFRAQPVRKYSITSTAEYHPFKPTKPVGPNLRTADRAEMKRALSVTNLQ